MTTMTRNFPLLDEIDDEINADDINWNKNAFQTLLTSNLPTTTIFYYAIDVGFRRLESSLYEAYWDDTADALNDLFPFLFNISSTDEIDSYLYEAKCQLLMYASIAIIKLNTIRRRSTNDAKMSCATTCLLLLEQNKSYETSSIKNEYSSCIRSMRCRYLKRILIIGQWLRTLSTVQLGDIQSNHERYMTTMIEHLFPAVSLREKINGFIDNCLLSNNTDENAFPDDEATSCGFVIIRWFPKFNEKTIEQHSDLMHMGLVNTLNQLRKYHTRQLICCIWILRCMLEADRVSLGVLNHCIIRAHFSVEPIDFEQKPITIESLNERDIIVFLLLCAQQNVQLYDGDSVLHPYLLYSSLQICTPSQIKWWQTAIEQVPCSEFVDHLAIIRLDDERSSQYPPKIIILETAKILFKAAQTAYEQRANRTASSYEQYAIQYLQVAKAAMRNQDINDESSKNQEIKRDQLFFFYPQKSIYENNEKNTKLIKQLIEQCDRLARQCDELKLLPEPEPPKTSSPIKEEKGFYISNILSSVHVDKEDEEEEEQEQSLSTDSTLFSTPPSNESDDNTNEILSPLLQPIISMSSADETIETPIPSLPPLVDMIFSHMNSVNQWINRFHVDNEGIQSDIHTIRDRLENLNRATSQMIFSNVKIFQSNSNANSGQCHPPS